MQEVKAKLADKDCFSFDITSMNSAIANHLSNDFNYIGFACGLIVFLFLWLSFGNLELALLSFRAYGSELVVDIRYHVTVWNAV